MVRDSQSTPCKMFKGRLTERLKSDSAQSKTHTDTLLMEKRLILRILTEELVFFFFPPLQHPVYSKSKPHDTPFIYFGSAKETEYFFISGERQVTTI